MKNILILIVISSLLFGCKSYVQVFNTSSSIKTDTEGFYVYENDSLKITFNFWKTKGVMAFSIYNKLNRPLYVDWKKSSYIDNSVKLDYWVNEETSNAITIYGSYFYAGPLLKPGFVVNKGASLSSTTTVKVERITFIPPSSNYFRSQFYILPISYYPLGNKAKSEEVSRNDKLKKKTKIFRADFSKENSPLVFRNYLTLSTSEDFETEFYVDNEFYIDEIFEMDKRHFEQYRYDETKRGKWFICDENGDPLLFSDFKKPSSFYLYMPK